MVSDEEGSGLAEDVQSCMPWPEVVGGQDGTKTVPVGLDRRAWPWVTWRKKGWRGGP